MCVCMCVKKHKENIVCVCFWHLWCATAAGAGLSGCFGEHKADGPGRMPSSAMYMGSSPRGPSHSCSTVYEDTVCMACGVPEVLGSV